MSPNGAFTRGVTAGRQAGEGGGIFTNILGAVTRVEKRRREEDKIRAEEERELKDTLTKLAAQAEVEGKAEPVSPEEGFLGRFGLKRPPTREVTPGVGEKATKRFGPGGRLLGTTVSPKAEAKKPTKWELEKEAYDEAFRRLGGSYMVGLDEESRREYENLGDQIYQEYLTQYEYTEKPEARPKPKPRPGIPGARDTGRITVISPQGERGNIPANQLQEALDAGYKQVR